jgi:hypothetical protein
MRDEGPAVPPPVERTLPTPSTTPSPTRAEVDPVQLLQADPRVSMRVKGTLKKCGAGSYPVSTWYGVLTGGAQPDLVVNVTTCKDSIGIATYVYRVADTPTTAAPSAGPKGTTGGTSGGNGPAAAGGANPATPDGTTTSKPAAPPTPTSPGKPPPSTDTADTADGTTLAAGRKAKAEAQAQARADAARQAKELPGRYQNVFTAEEPSVSGAIDRGELVVTQQVYAKGDSLDFPSGEDVVTYGWSKSKFTERYHVRNTYSKPDANDMGAPAPPVTVPKN